jgi:hypothetical protein
MEETIKRKWDFLLQCKPEIRNIMGNTKLIGGHISHNSKHEKIFYFVTKKGTFTYNEGTEEFERKLEIR